MRMRRQIEYDARSRVVNDHDTVYYRVVAIYRGDDLVPYALEFTIASAAGQAAFIRVNGQYWDGRYHVG